MNPMTMVVAAGIGCLLPAAAWADVCPSSNQPVSCHRLEPNDAISSVGDAVYPTGNYAPYIWNQGAVEIAPPRGNGSYMTRPGLELRIGAGGWGEKAAEPMAIASTQFSYLTDDGVEYLTPTSAGNWYQFPCEQGSSLCYYDAGLDKHYIWMPAISSIRRRYRATKTNPAPLPGSVSHLPILVDYRMTISVNGLRENGDSLVDGLNGGTGVRFGHFELFKPGLYNFEIAGVQCVRGNGVKCSRTPTGETLPSTGPSTSGTFTRLVPLANIDLMALLVDASLTIITSPICREHNTPDGMVCNVRPWSANGYAVADPYVYIDPTWEYADWFTLEMSSDETDTIWVVPERTDFDPETLTLGGNGNGGAGGSAGTGGKPATGGDGSTGDGATAGTDGVGAGGKADGGDDTGGEDGCGCSVVGGPRSAGLSWLALAVGGVALSRRRRTA